MIQIHYDDAMTLDVADETVSETSTDEDEGEVDDSETNG